MPAHSTNPLISRRIILLSCLAAVFSFFIVADRASWADDFIVIKNAKNSVDSVSVAEVKDVFIGRMKTWKGGGVVVTVLGSEGSPGFAWLAEKIFSVNAKTLMSKIKQEVFKGEMNKPISVADDDEAISQVKGNASAVAVVSAAKAASLPAGVTVLATH